MWDIWSGVLSVQILKHFIRILQDFAQLHSLDSYKIKVIFQILFFKGTVQRTDFWVELKNLLVIGPLLGVPKIFDFGLVFAEMFAFKNLLPGIVYYRESKLPVLFTAGSQNSCVIYYVVSSEITFFQQKHDLFWKLAE